jgi:hypothetical protein
MTTRQLSSTQQATIEDGKRAVLRPTSVPKPPTPPPRDSARRIRPDLTGLYDSVPQTEKWNSSRILQLNQCGQALVGWLSKPPPFVTPTQDCPISYGVFIAELRDKTDAGYPFFYREIEATGSGVNDFDPSWALSPFQPWPKDNPPDDVLVGHINFTPSSEGGHRITMKIDGATLFLPSPEGTKPSTLQIDHATLDFTQRSGAARLSSRAIRAQEGTIQAAFRLYQQQYMPCSYLDPTKESGRAWKTALDLFTPDGPLATLIRAYVTEADRSFGPGKIAGIDISIDISNRARLSIILERIRALLQFPWDGNSPHGRLMSLLLSRHAWKSLEIEGHGPMAFSDWLSWIAVHQQNIHGSDASSAATFPSCFEKLLAGQELYRYDVKFAPVASQSKSLGAVAGVIGLFSVSVTSCTGTRDFGRTDMEGGFAVRWGPPNPHPALFYGAFLEVHGGLGSAPGLPSEVSFLSSAKLSDADFNFIRFDIFAVDAGADVKWNVSTPFTKNGAKISIGGGEFLIRLHTHAGEVLEASFSGFDVKPVWKIDNTAKPDVGTKTWEAIKSWWKGEGEDIVKVTNMKDIFHVGAGGSIGEGIIGDQQSFATWKSAPPRAVGGTVEAGSERQTPAAFEKDKCTLDREFNGWSVRFLLETILATDLGLFSGAPVIDIHGYASPEGPTEYNELLSRSRCISVLQAIEDAFGYRLQNDLTTVHAHGEVASEDADGGNLHDPEADAEEWKKHEEEAVLWPAWRRVELNIRGRYLLRVMTVSSSDRS